jgi:hypothetical protein
MAPAFADQTPAWSEGSIRSVRSVAGATEHGGTGWGVVGAYDVQVMLRTAGRSEVVSTRRFRVVDR